MIRSHVNRRASEVWAKLFDDQAHNSAASLGFFKYSRAIGVSEALAAAGLSKETLDEGGDTFTTGPGGIGPHTHSLTVGTSETGPGGEDNHTHTVTAGDARTGIAVEHDHSIPNNDCTRCGRIANAGH